MSAHTSTPQTDFAAEAVRCHRTRMSGGWTSVLFAVCAVLVFATQSAHAQTYQWSNLAGMPGGIGNVDGSGSTARFNTPGGVAMDSSGNAYVADTANHTIRKVTPAGVVTTLAGLADNNGSSDGTGSAARFYRPTGVALDSSGNVYVADQFNHTIRKVTPGGVVTTLAGTAGNYGSNDGTGSTAQFNGPGGVAVDGSGNVYVSDQYNATIRKVTPAGVVTTLAGLAGSQGSSDGTGNAARFGILSGITVDGSGNVYVTDLEYSTIRKVTPGGVVTTLAGGSQGSSDGTGSAAQFWFPMGVAVDGSGNVYVADQYNNTLRKVTPAGVVSTLAGLAGSQGSSDGTGSAAQFFRPTGVAVDGSGNIFVADSNNNTLRKVTSTGVVSTLAGLAGSQGSSDGTGSAARFCGPSGVAVDASGNTYVADVYNHTIRKVTPGGVVSTLAGLAGFAGSSDGTGSDARFNWPAGVAVDTSGNVYVAESGNHTIRKVTPAGVVTTLAGTAGSYGSSDGTGSAARFNGPCGVAVDTSGNVYVADLFNYTIRKITPDGMVTTLAGSAGAWGSIDGTGTSARFNLPSGVTVDGSSNVYVADKGNATIRKVTPAGVVTTLAGTAGSAGISDGYGSEAGFNWPSGVAVDGSGNVYVADTGSHTIRKVTPAGLVTTIGGTAGLSSGTDGAGSAALFSSPQSVAASSSGTLYVADANNNSISTGVAIVIPAPIPVTLSASSVSTTGATLNGTVNANGFSTTVTFEYGPTYAYGTTVSATPATVTGSSDTAVSAVLTGLNSATTYHFRVKGTSSQGTTYGTDQTFTTSGLPGLYAWSNFAGMPGGHGQSDGTGSAARFNAPYGVAVDGSGNTYVADTSNNTIRKVTPAGVVTTLAGLAGQAGSSDGTGSNARFNYPCGIAVDTSGNVYVGDSANYTIRKITPAGVVTTLAGLAGNLGSSDGTGSDARFHFPQGLTVDASGNIYVADTENHAIRKITPAGVVTTLAGLAGSYGSNDGTGASAMFRRPYGVTSDSSGNLYVADTFNNTIRKITPGGVVSTIAGLAFSQGSSDGTGSAARFNAPAAVAVDSSGSIYVADQGNSTIRKITAGGVVSTLAGQALSNGSADGTGSTARFWGPSGLTIDGSDNLYVADMYSHAIRKVTPGGVVSTLAGQPPNPGSTDATGSAARFNSPQGIAMDGSGNIYVADQWNQTIRKITPGGTVSTIAGVAGIVGSSDGSVGTSAKFYNPCSVAVDGSGNVFVADRWNHTIRKITPGGAVTTLAGQAGSSGTTDGTGSAARFNSPAGVAVDGGGNVYVADYSNFCIRKVTPAGVVTTLAGLAGGYGNVDGPASAARFGNTAGVAVDAGGNVYVTDDGNQTIRKITPDRMVTTVAGGITPLPGSSDGTGSAARFNYPHGLAVDASGNIYVADTSNDTIRQITPGGVVRTIGGTAGVIGGMDGVAGAAAFSGPAGIAVSSAGVIFVADGDNNRISMGVVTNVPLVGTAPASSFSLDGATLNGSVNANGFSTSVSFEYGLTTAYGTTVSATPATVTGSSDTAVSAAVSGLSSATTYHFRVNGTSSQGTTYGADQTFTTSGVPTTVTTAPSSLSYNAATLNGSVSANGFSTAVSFEYGLTTAYGTTVSATPATLTGNSASAVSSPINGLSPSTTYHFRVNATNSQGATHGADMTFTTNVAPTATTQPAFNITTTSASLYGTLSNSTGFDSIGSFDIGLTTDYGTNITGMIIRFVGGGDGIVSIVMNGLSPGTTYHYRVKGTGSQGTILGDDVTFTTLPVPPTANTNPVALSVSDTSATVHGTVNANGFSTTVSFDYGLTTDYGSSMAATPTPLTDSTDTDVSAVLTRLAPGTTYHYRVSATSSQGTTTGADQTFTTLPRVFTPTSWRQQWYGMNNNTGTASDSADPFHTGVPNLLAYALIGPNQNPATATPAQLPQVMQAGPFFGYAFTEPTGVSNVLYSAEYSTSLNPADWQPVSDLGSGTWHAFVVNTDGITQIFMRLKLTNLDP